MSRLLTAAILSTSFLLVGCQTNPIVTKEIKTVVVSPPDVLLLECGVVKPPEKELFLSKSYTGREELLFNFSADLMKSLAKCNSQINQLRKWKTEQEKIHQKPT